MKRGVLTRRIAAAVLVSFAGLTIMALTPLVLSPPALSPQFLGQRIGDAASRLEEVASQGASYIGNRVTAALTDTIIIERPTVVNVAPEVVLTAGTLVARKPVDGGVSASVVLTAPVFEIALAETTTAPLLLRDGLQRLLGRLAARDLDKVTVRRGTVSFKRGQEQVVTLTDVDAEVVLGGGNMPMVGKGVFTYRGQTVAFEVVSPRAAQEVPPAAATWPLRFKVSSANAVADFEGRLTASGTPALAGKSEVRIPDAAKFAAWLDEGWEHGHSGDGIALTIRGLLAWSQGTLTFKNSRVALGDQAGTGALSVRYQRDRPLVEASLAFSALDVAPILTCDPPPVMSLPVAPGPVWRSLATQFPSVAHMDVDWRLSVDHVQWRGEPIGHGAVSVSARDGVVRADFAELEVGAHRGTLQVVIGEPPAKSNVGVNDPVPVSIRGQVQSTDGAQLFSQLFGGNVLAGALKGQFEVRGSGRSLGRVADGADGSGYLEALSGRIALDVQALQKFGQALQQDPLLGPSVTGWADLGTLTGFDHLSANFKVRNGALFLDGARLDSSGMTATAFGRIGLANDGLDLLVQLTPSQSGSSSGKALAHAAPGPTFVAGPAMMIRGERDRPRFTMRELTAAQ